MTDFSFKLLTPGTFADFERLFGPRGACAGCWCMFWKLRGKAYATACGEGTHAMQKSIAGSGVSPGMIAYDGAIPAGWIAFEPRSAYPRLAHSRALKPVDDQPVWSVTCFYNDKKYRRRGLSVRLLNAAVEQIRVQGGRIVEGYPVDVKEPTSPAFIFTGTASIFRRAGFKEVARHTPTRPIFRFRIEGE